MTCLQHKYVAHANLQRWVFCEFCGVGKEIGAQTAARETQPRPRRKKPPTQIPLNFDQHDENELEAAALRIMRQGGLNVADTVQETVQQYRERQTVPPEAYDTELASSTEFA